MDSTHTADDGVKAYTRLGLKVYDFVIYKLLVNFVWRCETHKFVDFYRDNITRNHADIGVGTSFCLDQVIGDKTGVRLALFDLNSNCLRHSAERLYRIVPEVYLQDVTQPFTQNCERFDSIALGGVLHCLPGDMREKAQVFDNLAGIKKPNTRVFGYTLINDGVRKGALSLLVARVLNGLKFINNQADSAEALRAELARRFSYSQVTTIAHIAFFVAY